MYSLIQVRNVVEKEHVTLVQNAVLIILSVMAPGEQIVLFTSVLG